MKTSRFLAVALALSAALTVGLSDADAKRLGGGRSVGKQSDNVTHREAAPAQAPQAAPAGQQGMQAAPAQRQSAAPQSGAAQQPARNRWLGPIAGLAAGLGLAALASHLGFGEELASMMLIALLAMVAVFVVRMLLARRAAPARAAGGHGGLAYAGVGQEASVPERWQPTAVGSRSPDVVRPAAAGAAAAPGWRIPADFDTESFLKGAKGQFVRLQAAFDGGRLDDLREFTTEEMFTELQRELRDRGAAPNRTDVVTLDAQLLGIESTSAEHIASVRFRGSLREDAGAGAEPFDEVWNLTKPADGSSGWLLAGIQQLS